MSGRACSAFRACPATCARCWRATVPDGEGGGRSLRLPHRARARLAGGGARRPRWLVFTAGIGEHAAEIRARVCRDARGSESCSTRPPTLTAARAFRRRIGVSAWVIPTDENLMIARHTRRLLDREEAR